MSKVGDIFSSLYNGYKKFNFHRDKFFSYRYFIGNYDEIGEVYVDSAKRKIIYNGKECYFPREILEDYQSLNNKYFWDGKQSHPIELPGRYGRSYSGNTIYAVPFADIAISPEEKKVFGFSKEELKNKTIVIEVDNSGKIVLPDPGEALYYSFSGGIKPTSFRITNRETRKTRWIPSLIILPFNLGGAVCSFACGIAGGILNKIGGGLFLNIADRISKGLDDKIGSDKNGVLKLNQRLLKTHSTLACVFESLASLFIAAGSVVEGVGHTTDALLRTPNLIFHHDDLDRKATWANIKSSATCTYHDLSNIGEYTINSFQACNAHIKGDIEKLQEVKSINTSKDTDDKVNKIHNNLNDMDKNKIKEVSKGLNGAQQSQIAVGTKEQLSNKKKYTIMNKNQ